MASIRDLRERPLSEADLAAWSGQTITFTGNLELFRAQFESHQIQTRLPDELDSHEVLVIGPSESSILQLVALIDRLLGPGGCPWDQAQTHESLKQNLLEEAYEVLDAIDRGDPKALREELGDLLLQPILHAQINRKNGGFDTEEVASEIVAKLIRRHPHVFGDVKVANPEEVMRNWDRIKAQEKTERASLLEGVPNGMASLLRAFVISKRAARVGFEWASYEDVRRKLDEELAELEAARSSDDLAAMESELGDVLFTVVNLARWLKVEPEEALRKMLGRFTARFAEMEHATPRPLSELSAEAWDDLWLRAKAELAI